LRGGRRILLVIEAVGRRCDFLADALIRLALFEPEIAGNVGAVLRLGACMGAAVDLIEPMGFEWDDRRVRRTAMDYIDHVSVTRHAGFERFRAAVAPRRLVLFTTKVQQSPYDFAFRADDVLLFGKESAGVPAAVADDCDARLCLPMRPQVRSMNLATAAALALGEALRQTGTLPKG
jgi:tRNA (cytidine/uridine-2'-O-)-methyltransferase